MKQHNYNSTPQLFVNSIYNEKGQRDGLWVYTDANGYISKKILYSKNELIKIQEYHPDGITLFYVVNYKSNLMDGPQLTYHPNGKLFIEIENRMGFPFGIKRVYNEYGNLHRMYFHI